MIKKINALSPNHHLVSLATVEILLIELGASSLLSIVTLNLGELATAGMSCNSRKGGLGAMASEAYGQC